LCSAPQLPTPESLLCSSLRSGHPSAVSFCDPHLQYCVRSMAFHFYPGSTALKRWLLVAPGSSRKGIPRGGALAAGTHTQEALVADAKTAKTGKLGHSQDKPTLPTFRPHRVRIYPIYKHVVPPHPAEKYILWCMHCGAPLLDCGELELG
jgi:hypothetical protein